MNLDERARRAAASIRGQAQQADTDTILDRIRGTGRRPRWVVPAVAVTAAAAAVILVVGLVLPQLQVDRVEIAPDPVVPGDPEPSPDGTGTPDVHPDVGVWRRVTDDEVFGGPGDQEMRAVVAGDGVTVAAGVDGEQAAVWRNDGDVTDPAAWERVARDLCGEASCEIGDIAAGGPGFAAVGTLDGLPKVWHSPDGVTWERIDLDVPDGGSERRLTVVTADRAGFTAFGSASDGSEAGVRPVVLVSPDGRRWTEEPVEFDFREAGAHVVDAVGFEGRVLALTQIGDGAGILERGDDGTWRVHELGPEFGSDTVLRALTVEERGLLLVATRFLGADETEPSFWRSTDGAGWSSVDDGLRVARSGQPYTAVSTGSTVMAVGATEDPSGDIPPHPAFWLEMGGSFQAMDGGPALRDEGRMLAALPVGRDLVLVVGEDGDLQDADAALWTYAVGEGAGDADRVGECSAAGADGQPASQPDLPDPVADIRRAIHEAAAGCRYEELTTHAQEGSRGFTYSFGGDDDPGGHWRRLEEEGAAPLRALTQVLDLPYATIRTQFVADEYETVYVWPSAFADDATDADWRAVIDAGLVTGGEAERMRGGEGYTGHRVGITAEGEWVFFVAGD